MSGQPPPNRLNSYTGDAIGTAIEYGSNGALDPKIFSEKATRTDQVLYAVGALSGLSGFKGGGATKIGLSEAKSLVSKWGSGTFPTITKSIRHHFEKHGAEVGAKDVWQYLRKAVGFASNLRRVKPKDLPNGRKRYTKNGHYVILDSNGKIVTYGLER